MEKRKSKTAREPTITRAIQHIIMMRKNLSPFALVENESFILSTSASLLYLCVKLRIKTSKRKEDGAKKNTIAINTPTK